MVSRDFVSSDSIRSRFSRAMSDMYRKEVLQYGSLIRLVADINADVLRRMPELMARLSRAGNSIA